MNTQDVRQLEAACLWAKEPNAPEQAKVLLKEIDRRVKDYSGQMCCYEVPPENRLHACTELNLAGIPVAWIEHDDKYGFELVSTNAYGDGAITSITFCPFCGIKLTIG